MWQLEALISYRYSSSEIKLGSTHFNCKTKKKQSRAKLNLFFLEREKLNQIWRLVMHGKCKWRITSKNAQGGTCERKGEKLPTRVRCSHHRVQANSNQNRGLACAAHGGTSTNAPCNVSLPVLVAMCFPHTTRRDNWKVQEHFNRPNQTTPGANLQSHEDKNG
jgi:hypothetical protein